jgi:N-formylglutamate deformylase
MKTSQLGSEAKASQWSSSKIVVLHIPHSSRSVPPEERQAICLDDAALNSELLSVTDAYTDELFPLTAVEADRVVFPVSRLVCDVERFSSDEGEPMASRWMGATYTRTSTRKVLRAQPNASDRQSLLDRWYWPHHSKLESIINDVTAQSGVCLIVDCHSFSSAALPYELNQTSRRADICIGTDALHTTIAIRDAIEAVAQVEGYSVAINAPFSDTLVPLAFYRKDRRVMSVMIEVNRRLYMDEHSGSKK